jgi:hypothetical protein
MLESPAYQALSLSAHRVIARIRLELCHHGGADNGKLPVTHRDFHKYGIHWSAIGPAIREAEALGFIRVTEHGIPSNGEFRKPNLFALTHLAVNEAAPTNDWKKVTSMDQANQLAAAVRKDFPRHRKFSKKRPEKTFLRSGNRSDLAPETGSQTANSLLRKPEHCATPETGALSISTQRSRCDGGPTLLGCNSPPPQRRFLGGDRGLLCPVSEWRANVSANVGNCASVGNGRHQAENPAALLPATSPTCSDPAAIHGVVAMTIITSNGWSMSALPPKADIRWRTSAISSDHVIGAGDRVRRA